MHRSQFPIKYWLVPYGCSVIMFLFHWFVGIQSFRFIIKHPIAASFKVFLYVIIIIRFDRIWLLTGEIYKCIFIHFMFEMYIQMGIVCINIFNYTLMTDRQTDTWLSFQYINDREISRDNLTLQASVYHVRLRSRFRNSFSQVGKKLKQYIGVYRYIICIRTTVLYEICISKSTNVYQKR